MNNDLDKALDYANCLFIAFRVAQNRFPELLTRFYSIGGYSIVLNFAGPALFSIITPSLSHLEIKPQEKTDLSVFLWDSFSTRTDFPSPPWNIEPFIRNNQRWGFNTDRFASVFKPINGTWHMLDKYLKKAIYWAPDFRRIPFVDRAFPLRTILNWWMQERGRQIIHGASVGNKEGSVLILGKGESGKSTVSLACLAAGMSFLGDDNILLGLESTPYIYSMYSSAKLYSKDLSKFPFLQSVSKYKSDKQTEKILFFLNDYHSHLLPYGSSFNSVLLPRITESKETRLKRVTAAQSLKMAAPHSIFTFNRENPGILNDIANIFRRTSHYILELGTEIESTPKVIADLIVKKDMPDLSHEEIIHE